MGVDNGSNNYNVDARRLTGERTNPGTMPPSPLPSVNAGELARSLHLYRSCSLNYQK